MACSSEDAKWNCNPCWFVCLWVISIDFSNISCWFGVWFRFRFEPSFHLLFIFIKIVHYSLFMSYLNYYYFSFLIVTFVKWNIAQFFNNSFLDESFYSQKSYGYYKCNHDMFEVRQHFMIASASVIKFSKFRFGSEEARIAKHISLCFLLLMYLSFSGYTFNILCVP